MQLKTLIAILLVSFGLVVLQVREYQSHGMLSFHDLSIVEVILAQILGMIYFCTIAIIIMLDKELD